MTTKFYRDHENKYVGKTDLKMNNGMELTIRTYSYNGVLTSTAQAQTVSDDGRSTSFVMFQDFNKRISSNRVRSSVKAIEAQHNAIDCDDILVQANAHYA